MVFSSVRVVSVAKISEEVWQYLACFGEEERIEGQQMLDLVICFPLQQLSSLILFVWPLLCVPPQPYYSSSYYDEDDDEDASSSSTTYHPLVADEDDDSHSD